MKLDFNKITDTYTLSDGHKIPCVGFGTWQSPDGEVAYSSVLEALRAGYRHIDTATAYGNEESVGKAINDFMNESGVAREDLYITTKLWNKKHGYQNTKEAIELSLKTMGLDYIDLYLIHWPNPIDFRDDWKRYNSESYKAMEEAYQDGKLRGLGLSNFWQRHIEPLLETAKVAPVVNQIKLCPGIQQDELVAYSRSVGMLIEAYSPMGTGGVLQHPVMQEIAAKYNRSVAQVCIRFSLEKGYLPLPKSVTPSRIRDNMDVFGFSLEEEDKAKMAALDLTGLAVTPLRNPDETTF